MVVTINDILPVSLCLATDGLFDTRHFRTSFGDNTVIRAKDPKLAPKITKLKRELNSMMTEQNFFQGHKTAILGNMDRILALVERYAKTDLREVEAVISNCKSIMERVMFAESFDELSRLQPEFKSKITLPVYSLFMKTMKRDEASFV